MDVKPSPTLSSTRKVALLLLFCFSEFLDTFNTSTLYSAIPAIATSTGLNDDQSVWLNSAYRLTFAAFLLISGRMSDISNPKIVFLGGMYLVGFMSLGIGFVRDSVAILVLRAMSGIGVALSVPSPLHFLVHIFPGPVVQARAIAAFSCSGVLGNVCGVIIGAWVVSYANWPWVFYAAAIVAFPIAIICTPLLPNRPQSRYSLLEQLRRLDVSGCSLLIAALVLFIFAVTSGSTYGWKTAIVMVPLFLSLLLFTAFFVWEAHIPEDHASLPPRLWSYPNSAPLVILALVPVAWWGTVYLLLAWYWQEVLFWSAIESALRFLPIGLFAAPFIAISSILRQKFEAKYILLGGLFLMVAGTAFLPFADGASRYWPVVFPGFLVGTAGTTIVFATTNIAIFAATPPEVAGTVGAVFNCALRLGGAVITSVATSIQTSVQPSPTSFAGRSAAFEFLMAFIVLQMVSTLAFVRKTGVLDKSTRHPAEPTMDF